MESADKENEPASYDVNTFKGRRLLLVEDNELNREIAATILKEVGFIIDTAVTDRTLLISSRSHLHPYMN